MARKPSWIIATEELEAPEIVAPEVAEVPSETVEAKLIEVDGMDRQIESLIDDGDQLTEDAENVEQLEETVEASQEDGGLDETAAEVVEIATESYCRRWAIRRTRIGKEAFGDSTTRMQATKFALEALDDAKKGLFTRFIELIKRLINAAKDAWFAFTNVGKSLRKRAEKIKEQYKAKFDGKSPTAPTEKLKGEWVKFCVINDEINIKGLMDFAAKSNTNFTAAGSESDAVLKKINEAIQGSKDTVAKAKPKADAPMAMQGDPKSTDLGGPAKDMSKDIKDLFKAASSSGEKGKEKSGTPEGAMDMEQAAYPGNLYLTMSTVKGMPVVTKNVKESKLNEVEALASQQMPIGISALLALADCMESHVKAFRYYDAGMATLTKEVKGLQEILGEAQPKERKEAEEVLKVARQSVLNEETKRQTFKLAMANAAKGLGSLLAESIKAYK